MGKLEDRVNEILGVESKPNAELMQQKEYKPPVVREEDKEKQDNADIIARFKRGELNQAIN